MTQFRKKTVVITAITFDQLVAHGLTQTKAVANGLPWAFEYGGHPITHESDDCYLIPTLEGTMKMGRDDMLTTGVKGEIYPCKRDIFAATYDAVQAAPEPTPSAQADQRIESELQAAGLNAPRVTADQIQALMGRVVYHYEQPQGTTSTFAHAFLDGFYLDSGYSACVSAENFNAAKGQKYAKEQAEPKARNKLWELEGYVLHRELARPALA